jgi:hypothetical protein
MVPGERLTPKQIQIATLVWQWPDESPDWQNHRNRRAGHQEPPARTFDKLAVWSWLELAMWWPAMAARTGPLSLPAFEISNEQAVPGAEALRALTHQRRNEGARYHRPHWLGSL